MNPSTMNPTLHLDRLSGQAADQAIVFSYSKYTIQSVSTSPSTPSYPHQPSDSIDLSASSPSSRVFTRKRTQTGSFESLALILKSFLTEDCAGELPELGRWVEWSRTRGYLGGRVIISGNRLHLLALTSDGGMDDYELPYSRGGFRKPVLRRSFTATHLGILSRMLGCKNVSGGYGYCGYCPACLSFGTDRKVFVNKKAAIRKLELDVEELDELVKRGKGMVCGLRLKLREAERRGQGAYTNMLRKKVARLEGWIDDPARHLRVCQVELDRLLGSRWRELLGTSKLIQRPHWFISISCPTPLHVVFDAQDGWLAGRFLEPGRRASDALRGILSSLEGSERGFVETMRVLFRKLVVEAVEALHPGIDLTMEHQLHPINKWDNAPDAHFLVCQIGRYRASGMYVDVAADAGSLHREVEVRMKEFAEFLVWAVKRWNKGCRAAEFRAWRREVLHAAATVMTSGTAGETVDVVSVPVAELVSRHCYLRRQPMQNAKSVFLDRQTGTVTVQYHGRKSQCARFGLVDLLWRFVGFDGRTTGVQYTGAYRSGRGMKRDRKVDAVYRAQELRRGVQADEMRCLTVTQGPGVGSCQPGATTYHTLRRWSHE